MYNEYFYINKNFQSSINLELDLNNENKIREYIPTTDICDVLKIYIKSILGVSNEKATTLVGPYGKGKSFLLLVLSYLIGNNKNADCWIKLTEKIKTVDSELYDLLLLLKEKNISLLTVIINSNYDNITQSFQLALNEALKRENLGGLIPETAYNVCLSLIKKWTKDEKIKKEMLEKCLEINKINIKKLVSELMNYSPTAYQQFEKLYNCMNIGLEFNPLVNNDIVKIYSDINSEIVKNGYTGMFIIFDEFSKFIESNSSNLMKDLKIVQDFAELCSRSSKKQQINLCCVTHKSISLYFSDDKKNNQMDSFKTVEGRFKEIKFNRSLEENYQMISYAIKKGESSRKIVKDYIENNKDFYSTIKELNLFSNIEFEKDLFEGCFPLNPITVYCLIQLSEYVAQNERTLFTFLSDTDENSFNSFICNSSDGLFCVDKIYDYFNSLLQKEEANHIRNIWYRAESLLSKIEDIIEKRIIKALAIILMINDFEKLTPNEETIALGLCLDKNLVENIISNLLDKHMLRKNILNNMLSFALSNSKHIDDSIEYLSKTKFKNIKISDYANVINEKKYLLPRKYNEKNKITRFYSVVILDETEFINMYDFSYLLNDRYCDGLVIYLLRTSLEEKVIVDKINKVGDQRVIIKYPKEFVHENLNKLILRYACLLDIKNQKGIDEISEQEINLLIEETEVDVKNLFEKYFDFDSSYYSSLNLKIGFNELLSYTLEKIYSVSLIFNNELINKKVVTNQYQKAINHVIDYLIDKKEDFNYSLTSPETSIKTAVLDSNCNDSNYRGIIDDLKNEISNSGMNKFNVYSYMKNLTYAPYGIREGILPIILAQSISELSDNVILYFQGKEIELDSNNLVKSISNDKYYLSFSKSSNEQKKYLEKLIKLFKVDSMNNFRKDTVLLSNTIKKYFMGLPQFVRSCTAKNNYLNIDCSYLNFKSVFLSFNINPFESIFEEPKMVFNCKNYKELYEYIKNTLVIFENAVQTYKYKLIENIKSSLDIAEKSSLKMEMNNYIKHHIKDGYKSILSDNDRNILNCIQNELTYNDEEALNELCKASLHLYIEDWDTDKSNQIVQTLKGFYDNLAKSEKVEETPLNLYSNICDESPMGNLLKNSLESILDEFSESVSTNEKIYILSEFIKKML